jgi:hypothetical protein
MKYLVRYDSKSALALERGLAVTMGGVQVAVNNDMRNIDGQELHQGLVWDVTLVADDIRSALTMAEGYVDWVANLLCTIHSAAIAEPRAVFAIDIDDATPDRSFAQMLWTAPILHRPRRKMQAETFRDVFRQLDVLRLKNPDTALRVDRALHYYRKSTSESDVFDSFEDACNGLQSIDSTLRKLLAAPKTFNAKCPRCSNDLRCKECELLQLRPETFGGTVAVIEKVLGVTADSRTAEDGRSPARRLVDARNDIVHARRSLDEVKTELPSHIPLARRALLAGLLFLLDFNTDDVRRLVIDTLELTTQAPALAVVKLHNTPSSTILSAARFPAVQLHGIEIARRATADPHFGESGIFAVQMAVSLANYDGEWTPVEGAVILPTAPEEPVRDISIRLIKG